MRRVPATLISMIWFVLAPGVVCGLLPWWITGWHGRNLGIWWRPMQVVGIALMATGIVVLLHAFARFVREGRGTPVPVAAPRQLVVGGLYRHVRNPMYVAVIVLVAGQLLLLARLNCSGTPLRLWRCARPSSTCTRNQSCDGVSVASTRSLGSASPRGSRGYMPGTRQDRSNPSLPKPTYRNRHAQVPQIRRRAQRRAERVSRPDDRQDHEGPCRYPPWPP